MDLRLPEKVLTVSPIKVGKTNAVKPLKSKFLRRRHRKQLENAYGAVKHKNPGFCGTCGNERGSSMCEKAHSGGAVKEMWSLDVDNWTMKHSVSSSSTSHLTSMEKLSLRRWFETLPRLNRGKVPYDVLIYSLMSMDVFECESLLRAQLNLQNMDWIPFSSFVSAVESQSDSQLLNKVKSLASVCQSSDQDGVSISVSMSAFRRRKLLGEMINNVNGPKRKEKSNELKSTDDSELDGYEEGTSRFQEFSKDIESEKHFLKRSVKSKRLKPLQQETKPLQSLDNENYLCDGTPICLVPKNLPRDIELSSPKKSNLTSKRPLQKQKSFDQLKKINKQNSFDQLHVQREGSFGPPSSFSSEDEKSDELIDFLDTKIKMGNRNENKSTMENQSSDETLRKKTTNLAPLTNSKLSVLDRKTGQLDVMPVSPLRCINSLKAEKPFTPVTEASLKSMEDMKMKVLLTPLDKKNAKKTKKR